jgi:rhodanese-related sulfurtransferase
MSSRSILFAFLVSLSAPFALSLAACGGPPPVAADESHAHISGSKAKDYVKNGAKLLDVRGADEYGAGHIEGAENSPVETISEADFGNKDTPIVLYCENGNRAKRAAATLRGKGYTHVYELGPMSNWSK